MLSASLLFVRSQPRLAALLPAWHVCANLQEPFPSAWVLIKSHVYSDSRYMSLHWGVGDLIPRSAQIVA